MASKIELLQEAYNRGILPPEKKALYDEAVKRGLINVGSDVGVSPPTTQFEPGSVPSLQKESFQSAQKRAGEIALPLAGDIAGTMIAPQFAIPHGIGTAATVAKKGVNLLSRMGGAGAGGFSGDIVAQLGFGDKPEIDLERAAIQGGLGAAGEGAFAGLGSVVKALRPLASKITFSGNILGKTLSNKLMNKVVKRTDDFLNEAAPAFIQKDIAGMSDLNVRMKDARGEINKIYEQYKEPLREAGKARGGKVLITNTADYLNLLKKQSQIDYPGRTDLQRISTILTEEFGYKPGGDYGRALKGILAKGEEPSADDLLWLIDNVFKEKPGKGTTFFNVKPSHQRNREALKKAYTLDLEDVSKAPKGQADQMTMEFKDFQYLTDKVFGPAIKDVGNGMKEVDPYKMATRIYAHKDKILKIDAKRAKQGLEALWPKLEDEAKFYTEMVPYFKRAKENLGIRPGMMGTASSFAQGGLSLGANAGAYGIFGPYGIIVLEGFGSASAYHMLSPIGRKAIEKAAQHVFKNVVKGGGHAAGNILMDFNE